MHDGSYSISDIEDYFGFIVKKHETLNENPPTQIYPNKIKSRLYKIELLSPKTMKLLGRSKKDVDKDKDVEDVTKTRICWSRFSTL